MTKTISKEGNMGEERAYGVDPQDLDSLRRKRKNAKNRDYDDMLLRARVAVEACKRFLNEDLQAGILDELVVMCEDLTCFIYHSDKYDEDERDNMYVLARQLLGKVAKKE